MRISAVSFHGHVAQMEWRMLAQSVQGLVWSPTTVYYALT